MRYNKQLLFQLYNLPAERDEIHAKFSESILAMQQKSGLKYMVLEKKITAMREELDIKDAQFHEIVKVSQSSGKGKYLLLFYSDIYKYDLCRTDIFLCLPTLQMNLHPY